MTPVKIIKKCRVTSTEKRFLSPLTKQKQIMDHAWNLMMNYITMLPVLDLF